MCQSFLLSVPGFNSRSLWGMALVAGLMGLGSAPVQAQESFTNSGIVFDEDTVVEFAFQESNGAYRSTFGVINLQTGERTPLLEEVKPSDRAQDVEAPSDYQEDIGLGETDDFQGTPGNTVPEPLAEFLFEANTPYGFYLESEYDGRPAGTLYSVDSRNPNSQQQLLFDGALSALAEGGILLRWDDTGSLLVATPIEDRDFDDFLVRAGGHIACPFDEPVGQAGNQLVASACQQVAE